VCFVIIRTDKIENDEFRDVLCLLQ